MLLFGFCGLSALGTDGLRITRFVWLTKIKLVIMFGHVAWSAQRDQVILLIGSPVAQVDDVMNIK